MPQLDKVTFLSQFFWLCFFYLGFYFFVYKFFLPKMARILKFRNKKISLSRLSSNLPAPVLGGGSNLTLTSTNVVLHQQEDKKVAASYETTLASGVNSSRTLFSNTSHRATNWVKETSSLLNSTQLKEMNNSYIRTLGENAASEILALQQNSSRLSRKPFFSLFLKKIDLFSKVRTTGSDNGAVSTEAAVSGELPSKLSTQEKASTQMVSQSQSSRQTVSKNKNKKR